ncbi:CYTH domain-containing protein [Reyranella sp.]|uniref:CYTH domain-containing protein n=1 Tax=Reyranella sp. TaxID=1929291 RepID=UPI003BACACA7
MGIEIERKFLVTSGDWRGNVVREQHLVDGLVAMTGGRKVRVRVCDGQATLTIKAREAPGVNAEFEYPIPLADAEELLTRHCDGNVMSKTRSFVPYRDFTWQVDAYDGVMSDVLLAEVELTRIDCDVPLPPWIGREVTGDPAYRKINLFRARTGRTASD